MGDILGLHHMTAICGPPQENVDFFTGVLGLRLVKLTVNFDDPTAYHLYYGDGAGTPGTVLTFFPYPNGYPGRPGRGQITLTSLSIPRDSVPFWVDRFREREVEFDKPAARNGGQAIGFRAPDGLPLELLASTDHLAAVPWLGSPVPKDRAIGSMRSITVSEGERQGTDRVLTELLGFVPVAERESRTRYELDRGEAGRFVDVVIDPAAPSGRSGRGSVHHIAFRVANDETHVRLRALIDEMGFPVSKVMDRGYFKSIYFREPGGALFEIATDAPGFAIDETVESLGSRLCLPPNLEARRWKIERHLPPLTLPAIR